MRKDIEQALDKFKIKTFGNKSNIERIENSISANEQVFFITPTNATIVDANNRKKETMPGIFALTDKRILFQYKILLNESIDSVSLDKIESINCFGNGLTGGHIQIHTIVKTYDILVNYNKSMIESIKNMIDSVIDSYKKQYLTMSHNSNTSLSSADEIKKFKDLLDSGIISSDEFEAKKKQLLGF